MNNQYALKSTSGNATCLIDNGELVSYVFQGTEIMHQKGDPGWGSTETEMFPIIGPTRANNFTIETPKGQAKLDQHGILRAMPYRLEEQGDDVLVFSKSYQGDTEISNPKFPNKSTQEFMDWPYDFKFLKTFRFLEDDLQISFEIISEKHMPFMLGFHPAFKVYDNQIEFVSANQKVNLFDVKERKSLALEIPSTNKITIQSNGKVNIDVNTKGFSSFMLWTEVDTMICVEPITFYPASVPEKELYKGFIASNGNEVFEVCIKPSLI